MKQDLQAKQLASQSDEKSTFESNLPGLHPPQFAFADGEDDRNKDGHFGRKRQFDGPLAAKGEGDDHEFGYNDVKQGNLEDCWLIASISAIARANPELLKNQIKDLGNGKYEVTLYDMDESKPEAEGSPRTVVVSNSLYVDHRTGEPITAGLGDQGEIWVAIIEKAFASFHGSSYNTLKQRHFPKFAMECLTGKPVKEQLIDPKHQTEDSAKKHYDKEIRKFDRRYPEASEKEKLKLGPKMEDPFNKLREWEIAPKLSNLLENGYAVTMGTIGLRKNFENVAGFKILGPHVYSLISVNLDQNTLCLHEPNAQFPLVDIPIRLVLRFFSDISYVKVA